MKRLLVCFPLVLAVGALVFPSSAAATHDLLDFQSAVDTMLAVDPTLDPPPNDGRHDFAVGGIHTSGPNYGFSAHSGPLGEEPFGHISITLPDADPDAKQLRYRVTCLNVSGNLAVVVGVPTKPSDSRFPIKLYLRDGGPGGALDGAAESAADSPEDCRDTFVVTAPIGPNGNILIHDA